MKPGQRQYIAQLIAAALWAPPVPVAPSISPMQPGWMFKKQAGDPR